MSSYRQFAWVMDLVVSFIVIWIFDWGPFYKYYWNFQDKVYIFLTILFAYITARFLLKSFAYPKQIVHIILILAFSTALYFFLGLYEGIGL